MLKKLLKKDATTPDNARPSRRKFLTGAAAATGAAMATFPMFARAQEKKGAAKPAPAAPPTSPPAPSPEGEGSFRKSICLV